MKTTSKYERSEGGTTRRALSLAILLVYGAQLIAACGPVPEPRDDLMAERHAAVTRLSGDAQLIAPANSVVPTSTVNGRAAGSMKGTFAVTEDGASTYTLPLWVPPGRAGLQPDLALNYHSRAGSGLAGVGFAISGTPSSITRCRKTVAQDGAAAQVRFDRTDAFCLDGARLVLVSTDKLYGEHGSQYRTEVDDFSRVTLFSSAANGPPDSFEVRRKDGRILLYGTRPGSLLGGARATLTQVPPTGVSVQYTQQVRYGWALSEVKDRQGNFMRLNHELLIHAGSAHEQRLKSIEYTGSHTDPSVAEPRRRVEFEYQSDVTEDSYVAGFKLRAASRLGSIRMYAPDVPVSETTRGPTTVWRSYEFSYVNNSLTGRSLLSEVRECDRAGICLLPTTFSWELGSEQFQTINTGINDVAANGLITNSSGAYELGARDAFNLQVADVNGDGKDDILYRFTPVTSTGALLPSEWRLRLSTGNGFGSATTTTLPKITSSREEAPDDLYTVDMNLDGKTDVIALNRQNCVLNVNGHYQLYRADGSTFTPFINDGSDAYDICPDEALNANPPGMQVGDLNGDGLPDLMRSWRPATSSSTTPTQWAWRLNQLATTGNLGFPSYTAFNFRSGVDHAGFVTDLDGDGTSEVLLRKPDTLPYSVSRSPDDFAGYYTAMGINSDGSTREVETTLSALPWDYEFVGPYHYVSTWLADVSGDGLPDAITIPRERVTQHGVPRKLRLAINTGNGFLPPQVIELPEGSLPGPSQWREGARIIDSGVRVLDFNMDGKQDLLLTEYFADRGVNRTHLTVLQSTGTGFVSKVLTAIPVGLSAGDGSFNPATGSTTDFTGSGWGQKLTRLADVNGDGLQDIIQVSGTFSASSLVVHLRLGTRPDLLKGVTTGNDRWVTIENRGLGTPGQHVPYARTYPLSANVRGMWVVSAYMADDGQDGPNAFFRWYSFTYEGAATDARGRGWLGFFRRIATDRLTNEVTTSWYDNTTRTGTLYLHAGLPKREDVSTPVPSGNYVRTATFTREPRTSTDGKTYFLCPTVSTTSDTDGSFGPVSWTVTSQQCDAYGNATSISTVVRTDEFAIAGTRLERTVEVENHPSTWVLGLPRRVTDTAYTPSSDRHPGGQVTTRTQTYQYCAVEPCPESNLLWRAIVEPEGTTDLRNVTTYGRDEKTGQATSVEVTVGGGFSPRLETTRYDTFEKLFPTVHINAAEHRTDVAYHPGLGVVALSEDPNGVRVRTAHDGFGRLREETSPYREGGPSGGPSLFVDYQNEPLGMLVTAQRAGSPTVVQRLDRWDREVTRSTQTADGNWSHVSTEYDLYGRPWKTTLPYADRETRQSTIFSYDLLDRPLRRTHPDGSYQEVVYEGRVSRVFSELRDETRLTRNPLGQVVKVEERQSATAPWQSMTYLYAPFGLLDAVTDPGNGVTAMEYDVLGRRTKLTEPKVGPLTTKYNAFGDVCEETDAAGTTTTYLNDSLGREVFISSTRDGTTRNTWDTALYGIGSLAKTANLRDGSTNSDDIVTAYAYDSLGRMTQEVLNLGGTLHSMNQGYDSLGRPDILTYPAASTGARLAVQRTYTATGYLASVRNASNGLEFWRAQERDAAGRPLREWLGDVVTTRHSHDGRGRLRFIESRVGAGGPLVQSLSYSYNTDGGLRSRHDTLAKVTERFQYDGLDRLTKWTVQAKCDQTVTDFGYDTLGSLASKRVVRNGTQTEQRYYQSGVLTAPRHALTGVSSDPAFGTLAETFTYDALGNQTRWSEAATGRFRNVTYTGFNLPATLETPEGTLSFAYDGLQRRVLKQHSNGDTTVYVGGLYEKRTRAGAVTHVFQVIAEDRAVAQVSWQELGGTLGASTAYLLYDHLGSVETVVDAAGAVLERRKHQPFGARGRVDDPTLAPTPSASDIRLGFTGHESDDEAGLINMKGRLYDPRVGRFLSPDPVVQEPFASQAHNRYAYVLNNPLRYVDPTGLTGEPVPTSVMGTGYTADGDITYLCASASAGDCAMPTPGKGAETGTDASEDGGGGTPASLAGSSDQNGSMEAPYIQSSCRWCVGDGRGLFAMSDQHMDQLQDWLRNTKLAYVPYLGPGLSALNLSLSLMRGNHEALAGDVLQVGLSLAAAKILGVAIKAAAPAASTVANSAWKNISRGVQIRRIGDLWVKRINPEASALMQAWGRLSLRTQARALDKLGDLATPHSYRNGMLFLQDVGAKASYGRTWWNAFVQGSRRIGWINDIKPHNMGMNGKIFDPALDAVDKTLMYTGIAAVPAGSYYVAVTYGSGLSQELRSLW